MASQNLTRTSYTDPSQAHNPTRPNAVQDSEALVDFTDYDKPLEQIHASNLHGWGIASGMTVTATLNHPGLQVLPGVAIDSAGQHISLAFGGFAQTGNTSPTDQSTLLAVTSPAGVNLPTAGLSGSMYLTIRFYETFDNNTKISSGFNVLQMLHTPWLQLVTTAPTDGSSLVLAQVTSRLRRQREDTHRRPPPGHFARPRAAERPRLCEFSRPAARRSAPVSPRSARCNPAPPGD